MKRLVLLVASMLFALTASVYGQDNYPSKSIRVIVPFAPGGSTDILVRPIAEKLGRILGQSVVIDNRGGAGGNIGAQLAAESEPDGYTLMITTSGVIVANKSLYDSLPYDPEKDFAPVSIIASLPNVLVVNAKSDISNVADLIAKAKANPGKVTYASGGNGTSNHLAGELLAHLANVKLQHIPYKGGGPAVTAALSGEVDMLFATMPSGMPNVTSGALRALAVSGSERSSSAPDLMTMQEAGVADFDVSIWIGALAPKGTPKAIVDKIQQGIAEVLKDAEIQKTLAAGGYDLIGSTPEEMASRIDVESKSWNAVIKAAGIRAQ